MRVEKEYGKNNEVVRERFWDESGVLVKERDYSPTPSGGNYSEICYLDNNLCVIRECKSDGTLINEIFGYNN